MDSDLRAVFQTKCLGASAIQTVKTQVQLLTFFSYVKLLNKPPSLEESFLRILKKSGESQLGNCPTVDARSFKC